MRRKIAFLLILAISTVFLLSYSAGPVHSESNPSGRALLITDLHFNPFNDPRIFSRLASSAPEEWTNILKSSPLDWGSYGKETTPWLFFSILDQLKKRASQADFVIFLGDVLRHDFGQVYFSLSETHDQVKLKNFIRKTYRFFYLTLAESIPGKTIVFALGNNDYYCGDYQIQPDGPFLSDLSGIALPYLRLDQADGSHFAHTFHAGGYYAMKFPGLSNHRLIVLNAIFFSRKFSDRCGSGSDTAPGREELAWLGKQLEDARKNKQPVWLVFHIPLGLDIYTTVRDCLKDGRIHQVVDFWRKEFGTSMQQLLLEYSDVVMASFSGHTHQDNFRVKPDTGVFDKIVPSLSPVFYNNPAFVLVSFDPESLKVSDYQTFYLDMAATQGVVYGRGKWLPEYDFVSTYGVEGLNASSLAILHQKIDSRDDLRQYYKSYYDVSNAGEHPMESQDRFRAYWCGQTYWNEGGFIKCYNH